MRVYKFILLELAFLLISACSVEPINHSISTPPPVVQIQVDPVVDWVSPVIQICNQQIPERGWIIQSPDTLPEEGIEKNIRIFWATPTDTSQNTFQITHDAIQIVVNPSLSLHSLTFLELKAVFSGKINQWNEIAENLPAAEIQVWTYPQSSSIMENFFQWSGLSPQSLSPLVYLAPNPLQLRNAVAENPLSIGILTTRWSNQQVDTVLIEEDQDNREFPVLAELTESDPYMLEWLFCIQSQINQ
ncbi:MAG: hypothetical protein KatS3mg047_1261 [Bellilinea sp.]|nr:MAG: hypothetical protein KatS3mg047_1261 [Bellilinea sp.]